MKKSAATATLLLVVGSSLVGVIGLGVAPLPSERHTILSPLQFQLNGRDPYTVRVPMKQGETISGEVNVTGGTLVFAILLQQAVMQSASVSGNYSYQFTAASGGTYELVFQSTEPVLVSVDIHSLPR